MVRRLNGRLPWLVACAAVLALASASPALAQSTGMIRGVVKDAAGKPVEGAKDNDKAEAAYKKAIELKADYAEAYNGLANVYNATRKFDLAAAASAKAMELSSSSAAGGAAGGGNADAMFNQGVILWNGGKIAE